jgi:putative ABC transport system permease protein
VLKKHKPRTQFKADGMVSLSTCQVGDKSEADKWSELQSHTFLKFVPGYDIGNVNAALEKLSEKVSKSFLANSDHRLNFIAQEFNDISPSVTRLEFNPYVEDLSDIYFNFSIPLLILLLASFNYVNLTLARSLSRSKEVGVRKAMGALRSQLLGQFLSEAVIISFLSLSLGLFLLWVAKNNLHTTWINWEVDNIEAIIISFVIFTLLLGLLAGLMPAIILSGFEPAKVLKGNISPASFGKVSFRKALIAIQFTVTLGFIFMMGHMYNQFDYMATENDNFNRIGIYNLSLQGEKDAALTQNISNLKEVKKVGHVSQLFGNMPATIRIAPMPNEERISSFYYAADKEFIENMQLKFVADENMPASESDSSNIFVVLNEKAVEKLHLGSAKDAIGKQVFLGSEKPLTIVGVIQNFCHFNYQHEIQPVVMQYNPQGFQIAAIQTEEHTNPSLFESEIMQIWNKEYPYQEAEGSWLSTDLYERYYPAEDMKIFGITGVIIFVIALMGLLGMLIYSSEKRVKEIGIRKVMGAEISQIIKMMAWSFIKLLLIATVIAVPFGIFSGMFINLQLFKCNNGVNYGLMALFTFVVLAIAGAAVGLFSFRAAVVNPVESLKSK